MPRQSHGTANFFHCNESLGLSISKQSWRVAAPSGQLNQDNATISTAGFRNGILTVRNEGRNLEADA
jgi:hypothetical protein